MRKESSKRERGQRTRRMGRRRTVGGRVNVAVATKQDSIIEHIGGSPRLSGHSCGSLSHHSIIPRGAYSPMLPCRGEDALARSLGSAKQYMRPVVRSLVGHLRGGERDRLPTRAERKRYERSNGRRSMQSPPQLPLSHLTSDYNSEEEDEDDRDCDGCAVDRKSMGTPSVPPSTPNLSTDDAECPLASPSPLPRRIRRRQGRQRGTMFQSPPFKGQAPR